MRMAPLRFRQITFQVSQLAPVMEIFADDGRSPSDYLSKRKEQMLVRWLANDVMARRLLCELLERPLGAFVATEVKEPFYGPTEGDIDLLVCDPAAPNEVAAFECKRVKVEVLDEGNDHVNKLEEVGAGVRQAKKLYDKFGFFQTYMTVISAIDSANRKQLNIPCRGITAESTPNWDTNTTTFRSIVEFPRREELPGEIIFVELVQPSGRSFEEQGTLRICVHHKATPRTQRASDTRKIEALMRGII